MSGNGHLNLREMRRRYRSIVFAQPIHDINGDERRELFETEAMWATELTIVQRQVGGAQRMIAVPGEPQQPGGTAVSVMPVVVVTQIEPGEPKVGGRVLRLVLPAADVRERVPMEIVKVEDDGQLHFAPVRAAEARRQADAVGVKGGTAS
jgi:hypothetical protein